MITTNQIIIITKRHKKYKHVSEGDGVRRRKRPRRRQRGVQLVGGARRGGVLRAQPAQRPPSLHQLDFRTSDGRACVEWIAKDTSSFFSFRLQQCLFILSAKRISFSTVVLTSLRLNCLNSSIRRLFSLFISCALNNIAGPISRREAAAQV